MIMKGKTPTLISGVPNVADSRASTRSHASATPSAPASTCPPAAQIVGLPSVPIRSKSRRQRAIGGEPVEAAAGREGRGVCGGQHDDARVGVAGGPIERRQQRVEQLVG